MSEITKNESGSVGVMKPSQLICYGMQAMEEFRAKGGKIDMNDFFLVYSDYCSVCLGGAAVWKYANLPYPFTEEDLERLSQSLHLDVMRYALDYARLGRIGTMFDVMKLDVAMGSKFDRYIERFQSKVFVQQMYKLADDLDQAGF